LVDPRPGGPRLVGSRSRIATGDAQRPYRTTRSLCRQVRARLPSADRVVPRIEHVRRHRRMENGTMVDLTIAVVCLVAVAGGAAAGFILRGMRSSQRMRQPRRRPSSSRRRTTREGPHPRGKDEKLRLQREAEESTCQARRALVLERRLLQRDEQLDQRGDILEQRDRKLSTRARGRSFPRGGRQGHQEQVEALERVSG